jgi:hypothetical protein
MQPVLGEERAIERHFCSCASWVTFFFSFLLPPNILAQELHFIKIQWSSPKECSYASVTRTETLLTLQTMVLCIVWLLGASHYTQLELIFLQMWERDRYNRPHFIVGDIETQRDSIVYPRSHSMSDKNLVNFLKGP